MISNAIRFDEPLQQEHEELDRFLVLKDVLRHVGIGKTTVYKLMKAGQFPKSFRINSTTTVVWSFADIKQWQLNQRIIKEVK